MKILALRLFALAVLIGASSWAVWGADGDKKRDPAAPTIGKTTTSRSAVAVSPQEKAPTLAPRSQLVVSKTVAQATTSSTTPSVATPVEAAPAKAAVASTGTTIVSEPSVHLSLSTLAPTPEMWFYEQMRQDYNNPVLQSRLRGERAAAERRARLAAREWYGVSAGRPMAHVTPFMYYYSPFFASNQRNPFLWTTGGAGTQVIIEARRPTMVSGFGVW